MTGGTRAEIAGAGAEEERVNLVRLKPCAGEGLVERGGGKPGSLPLEAVVELLGVLGEYG